MSDLYQTSADLRASVADLARQERPGAALTLTRSATLSITTAGTTITWQTETRNQGFTWSGTTITIPTSGYYGITLTYGTSGNHTGFVQCIVNGIAAPTAMAYSGAAITAQVYFLMKYFTQSDAVQLKVFPSTNQTIQVNAESGVQNASPFLHITQLTGVI